MADIRRRSGASTGSIYHHFGSKERLAATLYTEAMAAYQGVMLEHLAHRDDAARGAIEGIVRVHLEWVAGNRDLASFVFNTTHPDILAAAKPRMTELNRVLFGEMKTFLRDRQLRGELSRDLDLELFLSLVIAPAQQFARRWLNGETRNDMTRASRVLGEAAWRAVRASPD